MKTVCVIPARLASTRFPRKVLCDLEGKPLLQWVWDAAHACGMFDEICFAIDASETARIIERFEGRYHMTSTNCQSGTDRLIEVMQSGALEGDIWVNWQGDEPFIEKEMIAALLQTTARPAVDIWSLKKRIDAQDTLDDPNVVKVVTNEDGHALYFSRAPIPYCRDSRVFKSGIHYKHIGIYAFTARALHVIGTLNPTPLERVERLEQLRFLEQGLSIQVHETHCDSLGIDVPEDLVRAQQRLSSLYKQPELRQ